MQATYLQSLIALNATKIASKHAMRNLCIDNARTERAKGNISLMCAEFDNARKYLPQLSRLHTIQKALYAELKAHYRRERIEVKMVLVKALGGMTPHHSCDLTGHELEHELDRLIAAEKMKNLH